MTFRLPCNRLSVADTDAILALALEGRSAGTIAAKLSRPGTRVSPGEVEKVCSEQGVPLNAPRARA